MNDWLHEQTAVSPHKLALIIDEKRWNYGQLNQMVNATCAKLQDKGVRAGHFVAVLLPNGLANVCLVHALARLGAILVPLNIRLTPTELRWQLKQVTAKWLLVDKIDPELLLEDCEQLIVNETWLIQENSIKILNSPFTIHRFQSIVFTSGTSGKPKGVLLTFANHFWSANASAYRLGINPYDIWLSVLPLYHVGGLAVLFRSCLYGTAVSLHTRFDPEKINHDLDINPITMISLVPTMLHRLLQSRTYWPTSLRLILLGGAAAAPALVERANLLPRASAHIEQSIHHSQVPLVAPTYGLTEAASQVATMLPADAANKAGSVGKPLMFTQVKIVDEAGEERPSNEIGEIVVTGPTVMAGYYQKEIRDLRMESSQSPFSTLQSPINTIHTGDLGYLDADGDLFLVQRRSDLIVSGGENIYPAEVEAVLRMHTAVTEACVVGLPDAEWGQRVVAMVQVGEDTAVTPNDLITFCRKHLAGYKIPRQFEFAIQLPLTASGKIGRKKVEEIISDTEN